MQPEMLEPQTYTVFAPNGVTDFIFADTMFDAWTEARDLYGDGVTLRPSFYGEWECGTKESGPCYYEANGEHVVMSKPASDTNSDTISGRI
jgi:hypothetical protein